LSLGALFFTLVLSLRPYSFLGVSLSLLCAAALSLLLSRRLGWLRGGALTLLLSLGTLAPAYLPSFAALCKTATFTSRTCVTFPLLKKRGISHTK
jgi:hypothetical protein